MSTSDPRDPVNRTFLGHPVGLYVLFFTEMWERFSYYGMRAILILYLTVYLQLTDQAAGGIYGDYTGLVYLTPLLGGYLSDRFLGLQRAIIIGGLTMAVGQFCLAAHAWPTAGGGAAAGQNLGIFWIGLILMILGNGLFKPNISTIVGKLYGEGDPRRDGGFTIFYMGINIGALSPFIVGYFAQSAAWGWHWGFLSAGIGMVLGVGIFLAFRSLLGGRGLHAVPAHSADSGGAAAAPLTSGQKTTLIVGALPGVLAGLGFALKAWNASGSAVDAVRATLWPFIFSICVCMYLFLKLRCERDEMKKVNVIFVLGLFVLFFWAAFEQAGSSLTLFADRYTNNRIGSFEFPSSWFQNVNPAFIILLAPVFSWLWVKLAKKGLEPSTPTKMAFGLFSQVAAYVVMIVAMAGWSEGEKISPWWLVALYFLQTCGELCLSPVGLSMVTKLAPVRFGALLMGVWFLANAWANKLAGVGAGYIEPLGPKLLFMVVAGALAGVGLILVFCVPWLRRQMGGIH